VPEQRVCKVPRMVAARMPYINLSLSPEASNQVYNPNVCAIRILYFRSILIYIFDGFVRHGACAHAGSKRQRVAQQNLLAKHPQISAAKLREIATDIITQPGLLDASAWTTSRWLNKRRAAQNELMMSFKLDAVEGEPVNWKFLEPIGLLADMVTNSSRLQDLYAAAAAKYPCSPGAPWSMIVSFDEYTPGHQIIGRHKRKVMVMHFSFLELGPAALCSNKVWLTPVCTFARTKVCVRLFAFSQAWRSRLFVLQ
jgi:hypothetical protein